MKKIDLTYKSLSILNNKNNIFIEQPFGKQGSIDYLIIIEGVLFLIEIKTSKKYEIVLKYLLSFENDSYLNLKNIYLINGSILVNKDEYNYLNNVFKKEDSINLLKNKTKEELLLMKKELEKDLFQLNNEYIKNVIQME